jgi:hypothetical protein
MAEDCIFARVRFANLGFLIPVEKSRRPVDCAGTKASSGILGLGEQISKYLVPASRPRAPELGTYAVRPPFPLEKIELEVLGSRTATGNGAGAYMITASGHRTAALNDSTESSTAKLS